jgi:hypothetical protein
MTFEAAIAALRRTRVCSDPRAVILLSQFVEPSMSDADILRIAGCAPHGRVTRRGDGSALIQFPGAA